MTRAPMLTIAQVAEHLQVSEKTVLRMIHAGTLRAIDVARTGSRKIMRVDQRDLDRWLESRRVAA